MRLPCKKCAVSATICAHRYLDDLGLLPALELLAEDIEKQGIHYQLSSNWESEKTFTGGRSNAIPHCSGGGEKHI